mmetsp:Transcript_6270/g.14696  ORF Transcript_6270/g.14696 Transcript_6270/m.14696 type:complete len:218 (+) Transcript_6270:377-1030(+)
MAVVAAGQHAQLHDGFSQIPSLSSSLLKTAIFRDAQNVECCGSQHGGSFWPGSMEDAMEAFGRLHICFAECFNVCSCFLHFFESRFGSCLKLLRSFVWMHLEGQLFVARASCLAVDLVLWSETQSSETVRCPVENSRDLLFCSGIFNHLPVSCLHRLLHKRGTDDSFTFFFSDNLGTKRLAASLLLCRRCYMSPIQRPPATVWGSNQGVGSTQTCYD